MRVKVRRARNDMTTLEGEVPETARQWRQRRQHLLNYSKRIFAEVPEEVPLPCLKKRPAVHVS